MKGSMDERPEGSGRWRLRVYVGRDAKKHPVHRSRTFYGTQREAATALAKLVAESEHAAPTGGLTVAGMLDRWLEQVKGDHAPYYLREATRRIEKRLKPAFGSTRVEKLRAEQIDLVYRRWVDEGLSPVTVKGFHSVLSSAYKMALKYDWVDRSPMDKVTLPRGHTARPQTRAPSVGEIRTMVFDALEYDPMLGCAIALAATTGMRRGELCALRWSDVDLDRSAVTVSRALIVIRREWHEGPTKTHADRRIALDADSHTLLLARRQGQVELAEHAGVALVHDPFVLSRRADGSTPCLPDGLTHSFESLCERLDLPAGHQAELERWRATKPPKGARRPFKARPYHWHELRHAMASQGVEGFDAVAVARRLGHSDPALTLRRYAHGSDERDVAMAASLGRAILAPAHDDGPFGS